MCRLKKRVTLICKCHGTIQLIHNLRNGFESSSDPKALETERYQVQESAKETGA